MKRFKTLFLIFGIIISLMFTINIYAIENNYKGVKVITSDVSLENEEIKSTTKNECGLIIKKSKSSISNINLSKSGNESDNKDKFNISNSGILIYDDATLNLTKGNIIIDTNYSNAVFSYGNLNVTNLDIKTIKNNSNAIYSLNNANISLNNLNIETEGDNSKVIITENNNNIVNINGGTYKTSGNNSPIIYSKSNVIVKNAVLESSKSDSIIIEGKVSLDNTSLKSANRIVLKQDDNKKSTKTNLDIKNSSIVLNGEDSIFVNNSNAVINLENSSITNNNGKFLNIKSNGELTSLNLNNQNIFGSILVDNKSILDINMINSSTIIGSINNNNQAKQIKLTLSKTSSLVLTSDTYLTSLINKDKTNSNIYLNGYNLYVKNKKIKANNNRFDESKMINRVNDIETEEQELLVKNNNNKYYFLIVLVILIVLLIIGFKIIYDKKIKKL